MSCLFPMYHQKTMWHHCFFPCRASQPGKLQAQMAVGGNMQLVWAFTWLAKKYRLRRKWVAVTSVINNRQGREKKSMKFISHQRVVLGPVCPSQSMTSVKEGLRNAIHVQTWVIISWPDRWFVCVCIYSMCASSLSFPLLQVLLVERFSQRA